MKKGFSGRVKNQPKSTLFIFFETVDSCCTCNIDGPLDIIISWAGGVDEKGVSEKGLSVRERKVRQVQ